MESDDVKRGIWGSKIGFVLAAAGSAIGLGNIWRFPTVAGRSGGAAFVIIYLVCIFMIGLPVLVTELSIGRHTRKNTVGAFKKLAPNTGWKYLGIWGIIAGICILSFYSVIAGWIIGYFIKAITGGLQKINTTADSELIFTNFAKNPIYQIGLLAVFIVLTCLVIVKGVKGGIEKWSKILMPVLLLLLFALVIRSVTLPGASEGLSFYLKPDFSKINLDILVEALGQALFTLSLGMGTMLTYGSYLSKKDNLSTSALYVCLFDTGIALVAGLMIFPALFAMNMDPDLGPSLIFQVIPAMLAKMPGGYFFGTGVFLLIGIAALTSSISMLEVPVAYVVDEKGWSRKKAVTVLGSFAFVLGLFSALSNGAIGILSRLPLIKIDFLTFMDTAFSQFGLATGSLLEALFLGWVWGTANAIKEIEGEGILFRYKKIWVPFIKIITPLLILIIFADLIRRTFF